MDGKELALLFFLVYSAAIAVCGFGRIGSCGELGGREHLRTYPWPPVLGGAPVSPSPMARAVVVNAARRGRRAAVLVRVVRSILV